MDCFVGFEFACLGLVLFVSFGFCLDFPFVLLGFVLFIGFGFVRLFGFGFAC